ncbi:MAG: phosphoribosylaminoimidazolesuccinocarboxamide synthase [Deltaproteobacteria bacterium RBG_16_54_11]|nr:MAG: phosphoribosylaminoimidazolesuccinocarboxamide synthase [Deltaproteobacteria bacterium RBG_16_54_11]
MHEIVVETNFPDLRLFRRGKVRDVYEVDDKLLIVATDRVSAFDVIMADPIPGKGRILTQISAYWFHAMEDVIPHHLISTRVQDYPPACRQYRDVLEGRSMLVRRSEPLTVECVARGYLAGSGWNEYRESGKVCGIRLPEGLVESARVPDPIFTPATKEELGSHDINITFEEMVERVGQGLAERLRETTLTIYERACRIAEAKGIIIADTKLEFGMRAGELILIDELLTPDSSRFWPAEGYKPGGPQQSFDKQFLRDYLLTLAWDKSPPPPQLPKEIVAKTGQRYEEALRRLIG